MMDLYENGRRDAERSKETSGIDAETRYIHNTIGMRGEYKRGWRDWVNEQRAARGLGDYLYD